MHKYICSSYYLVCTTTLKTAMSISYQASMLIGAIFFTLKFCVILYKHLIKWSYKFLWLEWQHNQIWISPPITRYLRFNLKKERESVTKYNSTTLILLKKQWIPVALTHSPISMLKRSDQSLLLTLGNENILF